ncbi:sensor histidine kinase [Actinosynnema pretiosum]|uniref:histidine kinase n=1 Tax=Actinosynnema pretiosum TaxID=42197 RepID=A0A290Z4M9_9PSEU|nr:PAS domain-containing sensor histidine kinase [Actinosynnema pretiosum]ATE54011.1 hypothetical protein CNX65_12500 [Actinosynnema pretiosum]
MAQAVDPAEVAAVVRSVVRAGYTGRAPEQAVRVLLALPGVLSAMVREDGPPWRGDVVVPLERGGAVVVQAEPVTKRLQIIADAVAAALDGVGPPAREVALRDAIVSQMPTMVALFDANGYLRWSNTRKWMDGTALVYGEHVADTAAEGVHPDDRETVLDAILGLHAADPGGTARVQARVRGADGGWIFVDVIVLDRIDDPVIGGLVTFSRDMTDLRDAQYHSRVTSARLYMLIDALRVGVILQDNDRKVLTVNTTALELLDLEGEPRELVGLTGREMGPRRRRPPEDYEHLDRLAMRCVTATEPVHASSVPLGPDRVLEVDFLQVRGENELFGQLWVLRDVTDQVSLRRALETRNAELSRLSALKTEFISTISHELRTPLTALTSLTPLLVADWRDGERQVAEAVERNVNRMAGLVETLLLLAKVESHSKELEIASVDLDRLVRDGAHAVEAAAEARAVRVQVDTPVLPTQARGDGELLSCMTYHAVAAAVATSPPSASVRVTSTVGGHGEWSMEVTDEVPLGGAGGRLFTTLPREGAGSGGDQLAGSALGLALVRAIAERHGGAVFLTPSPEGGTTVRIELPLDVRVPEGRKPTEG